MPIVYFVTAIGFTVFLGSIVSYGIEWVIDQLIPRGDHERDFDESD